MRIVKNMQNLVQEAEDDKIEEAMTYNDLITVIASQLEDCDEYDLEKLYTSSDILDHEGPLTLKHPNYTGNFQTTKAPGTMS
jgi:hypothetical protein